MPRNHNIPDRPSGRPDKPNFDQDGLDQICWACRTTINHTTGVSLLRCDGLGSYQVCYECWEQIPVAERVKLQWMFRDQGAEGSGLADLIREAKELVAILRERMNHGDGTIDDLFGGNDE